MKRLRIACGLWLGLLAAPGSADTYIHAGRVIDGKSDLARGESTIVVRDGQIVRILPGFVEPGKDDDRIDLSKHTLLPGLMDMHTHLVADGRSALTDGFELGPADLVLKAEKNALATLMAGFTLVRDLGDSYNVTVALRKAIDHGDVVGPHIFAATSALSSTGGHGDPTNGLAPALRHLPTTEEGVIDSPDEARKAVRQRYKDGADVIKVMATGGVMSLERDGQGPQLSQAEMDAIVATARDYGMTVAAHAHGAEGLARAIRAGVATIEHGTYLNDDLIRMMKERGTFLVPTLMAGEWISQKAAIDGYLPPAVRPKAAAIGPLMAATFTRARQAGVRILFGTDSGVSAHGENAHEFVLMTAAGMPAMDAIRSATSIPAAFLGIADRYGTVEAGKVADLIAVPGDPVTDIAMLGKVDFVMLAGRIVKAPR